MGWNAPDPGGVSGYFQGGITNAGSSGRGWRGHVSGAPGLGKYWSLVDQLKRTPTDQEWADFQSGGYAAGQTSAASDPYGKLPTTITAKNKGSTIVYTVGGKEYASYQEAQAALAGAGAAGSYASGSGSIPSSGSSSYSAMWGGSFLPTAAQERQIRTRYAEDVKEGLDVLGTQQAARGMFSGARQDKKTGEWIPGYGGYKAEQYKTGMDQQMESEIERLRNAAMMQAQGGASNSGDTGDDTDGLADILKALLGGNKTRPGGETRQDPIPGQQAPGIPPPADKPGGPVPKTGVNPPPSPAPNVQTYDAKQVSTIKAQIAMLRANPVTKSQGDAMYWQYKSMGWPVD